MAQTNDFQSVQKRTIQLLNYDDGLWDLLLGCMMMLLAVYPVTRELLGPEWNILLFLGVLALLVVAYSVARRYVSVPRVGYARQRRSPGLRALLVATVILFLLTLGLLVLTMVNPGWFPDLIGAGAPAWLQRYLVDILVLLATVSIFTVLGYISGVARLYLYGWLIGIGNLASVIMGYTAGWVFNLPLAVAAGIIIVIGLWHLIRFIQRYPVATQEV